MSKRELDEDDVRVRPGKGTRRRTRERPAYADASDAIVIEVDRGRYTCALDQHAAVVAVRGADARRAAVVVGDRVRLDGDVSGHDGSLARIVEVQPRRSVLRRTPDDTDPQERPIVANADQLVIVASVADPPMRAGLVDRCCVAAYDGGLLPVLVLTKTDLADPTEAASLYRPLAMPVLTLAPDADLEPLRALLAERSSVLFGHSGVGKSTLVNRLVPEAHRAIGVVNDVTGRGRHTSSSAVALPLPGGGWVVDTPGIRSFGLGLVSEARVVAAFPDLTAVAEACPRGCTHRASEPECALDAAVAAGTLPAERVEGLRRLLTSRDSAD